MRDKVVDGSELNLVSTRIYYLGHVTEIDITAVKFVNLCNVAQTVRSFGKSNNQVRGEYFQERSFHHGTKTALLPERNCVFRLMANPVVVFVVSDAKMSSTRLVGLTY